MHTAQCLCAHAKHQHLARNESTQCEHAATLNVCMYAQIACVLLKLEVQEREVLCTQNPFGSDFTCGHQMSDLELLWAHLNCDLNVICTAAQT